MNIDVPLQFMPLAHGTNPLTAVAPEMILGMHCLGLCTAANTHTPPTQQVSLPILGQAADALHEIWHVADACQAGQFESIAFRRTDAVLFGTISIDEASLHVAEGASSLLAAAESAYRQIFALLAAEGFPHLWRTWNYLPAIHAEECGLERYRQFNIGRHQAFGAFERPVGSSPAACALGVDNGPLSIAFIAGRRPSTRIENPRQVSAFAYPSQYGPRSPTFTRAATVANGDGEILFISGTASIVGHETQHHGDVAAQTRETVANLAALLEQANLKRAAQHYTLQDLIYRVYIRHASDYAQVRDTLESLVGNDIQVLYVQAEVCRRDLLVEIEAVAFKPLKGMLS